MKRLKLKRDELGATPLQREYLGEGVRVRTTYGNPAEEFYDQALRDADFAIGVLTTQMRSWRIDPVVNVDFIREQIEEARNIINGRPESTSSDNEQN